MKWQDAAQSADEAASEGRAESVAPGLRLRFGVAQFDRYDPLADIDKLEMWGFDYCEPQLTRVASLSEAEFQTILKTAWNGRVHVEVMNSFLPADLNVVGPQVDLPRLRDYLRRSLARAEALGAKVIVFGSGDARMVPGGFSKHRAWNQLQEFLRMAGDEISRNRYGMVIGIEAMRKAESNIVNTSAEAYQLAVQTDHPTTRIMIDFFHLASEQEDPAILRQVKDYVVHLHLADPFRGRAFPRLESGNPAYRAFFSCLREIGYQGRMSLEAITGDFQTDAPDGLAAVQKLYADSCGI
jgi:D-psicose/D-tagatose/L-ribulose 3-epimerase